MTEQARKDRIEVALDAAVEMLRDCGVQLRPSDTLGTSGFGFPVDRTRARALPGSRRVQTTIPSTEFHALEQAARRLGCSRANICRYAISAFLEALAVEPDALTPDDLALLSPIPESGETVQLSLF